MREKFTEAIQICEKALSISNQRNGKYMKWFLVYYSSRDYHCFNNKNRGRGMGVSPGSASVGSNLGTCIKTKCSYFLT